MRTKVTDAKIDKAIRREEERVRRTLGRLRSWDDGLNCFDVIIVDRTRFRLPFVEPVPQTYETLEACGKALTRAVANVRNVQDMATSIASSYESMTYRAKEKNQLHDWIKQVIPSVMLPDSNRDLDDVEREQWLSKWTKACQWDGTFMRLPDDAKDKQAVQKYIRRARRALVLKHRQRIAGYAFMRGCLMALVVVSEKEAMANRRIIHAKRLVLEKYAAEVNELASNPSKNQ